MKKYIVGLGISSIFILAGCSNAKETVEVDEIEPAEIQTQENETSTVEVEKKVDEEVMALEYPYDEIKKYFDEWELPEGGEEGKDFMNAVTYENGYTFEKDTKMLIARVHPDGVGPAEPTEDQAVGVIMGWLVDAAAMMTPEDRPTGNATSGQVEPSLLRLKDAQALNNFAPLNEWIGETQAIFENFAKATDVTEKNRLYTEGYNRMQKMTSIIIGT